MWLPFVSECLQVKYYNLGPGFAIILHLLPDSEFLGNSLNVYTYPGWFCLALWTIYVISFLVLFDDSVISYSKTCEPDKSTVSIRSEDTLRNINAQYYDDNLVRKDIEELIKEESTTFSYIAVAFTILTLVLFLLRVNLHNTR